MFEIVPEYYEKDELIAEGTHLPFVYLHGALEQRNGYDLVGYKGLKPEQGIHQIQVLNEDCTFYYWKDQNNNMRGLIVSNTDTDVIKDYAKNCYDRKASII